MTIRNMTLLILSLAILSGCGEETPSIPRTMVEAASPVIGADGKLAQSIGIETLGGVFTPLLSQGSVVPCSWAEVFSTVDDNQNRIMVKPYRGTAKLVAECSQLGQFEVIGIPPAPRGTPQIAIAFAVQAGNIVLSAEDLSSGRSLAIKRTEDYQQSEPPLPPAPVGPAGRARGPHIGRDIRAALLSPADSPTWFIFALGLAIVVAYGIASMARLNQGIPLVDRAQRLVMIAVGSVIWGIGEAVFRTMRWFEMEPYAASIAAKMDPLIFCVYPLIRFTFLGAIALALAITFELLDSRRRQVSRRSS